MKTKDLFGSKYFYVALVALLGLVFLFQNNRPVTIDFFFWTLASANLLVLLVLFLVIGAAAGFFGSQFYNMRRKQRKESALRKKETLERKRMRGSTATEGAQSPPLH